MQRIHLVGTSGSGKTTLAKAVALQLDLPHVELDAIRHGPDWIDLPDDLFRARVAAALSGDRWVVDGNYRVVRELIWARADTVVWLDFPLAVVFSRVFSRTLRRCLTGEELWNGNRETFKESVFSRDSVIVGSVRTFSRRRREFGGSLPAWQAGAGGRQAVRLRSPRAAAAWLQALEAP